MTSHASQPFPADTATEPSGADEVLRRAEQSVALLLAEIRGDGSVPTESLPIFTQDAGRVARRRVTPPVERRAAQAPPLEARVSSGAPAEVLVASPAPAEALVVPPPPVEAPARSQSAPPPPDAAPALEAIPATRQRPSVRTRKRIDWGNVGLVVRDVIVIALLFVLFQVTVPGLGASGSQSDARREFAERLSTAKNAAAKSAPVAPAGGVQDGAATPPVPAAVASGTPIARLKIKKIGLDQVVIEGTDGASLRKGPGHFASTPLPGQPGNSVIAGHRVGVGAAFAQIDQLTNGDRIEVTTLQGTFVYRVRGQHVVGSGDHGMFTERSDDRLTLTSAHPKYSVKQQYVVWATLDDGQVPAAAAETPGPRSANIASEVPAWFRDRGVWIPLLFWGAVLLAGYVGLYRFTRGATPRRSFGLGWILLIVLMLPFFHQLSRAFPANY